MPKMHDKNKIVVEANEGWAYDISTVKAPREEGITVTRPVWHIVVDEAIGVKISSFYTAKNKIIKPMYKRMHKM